MKAIVDYVKTLSLSSVGGHRADLLTFLTRFLCANCLKGSRDEVRSRGEMGSRGEVRSRDEVGSRGEVGSGGKDGK